MNRTIKALTNSNHCKQASPLHSLTCAQAAQHGIRLHQNQLDLMPGALSMEPEEAEGPPPWLALPSQGRVIQLVYQTADGFTGDDDSSNTIRCDYEISTQFYTIPEGVPRTTSNPPSDARQATHALPPPSQPPPPPQPPPSPNTPPLSSTKCTFIQLIHLSQECNLLNKHPKQPQNKLSPQAKPRTNRMINALTNSNHIRQASPPHSLTCAQAAK